MELGVFFQFEILGYILKRQLKKIKSESYNPKFLFLLLPHHFLPFHSPKLLLFSKSNSYKPSDSVCQPAVVSHVCTAQPHGASSHGASFSSVALSAALPRTDCADLIPVEGSPGQAMPPPSSSLWLVQVQLMELVHQPCFKL